MLVKKTIGRPLTNRVALSRGRDNPAYSEPFVTLSPISQRRNDSAKMPSLDVSELNIALSILGSFIILYGVISVKIKRVWYLGEARMRFDHLNIKSSEY